MPYVQRNKTGEICAVSLELSEECKESVENNAPELSIFLNSIGKNTDLIEKTDLSFVRVLEDVIDLLISKNTILLTELPPVAQRKIAERQHLRKSLRPRLDILDDDQEESLF